MARKIIITYSFGCPMEHIFVTEGDEYVPYTSPDNYARGLLNFYKNICAGSQEHAELLEEILSKMTQVGSMINTVKVFTEDKTLVIKSIYVGCETCWELMTDVDDCSAV